MEPSSYPDEIIGEPLTPVRSIPRLSTTNTLPLIATLLFTAGLIAGHWLIESSHCYPILGCNAGFGGYDALLHFVAGIMEVAILVRLRLWASFNSTEKFWKNFILLLSLVALLSVGWEILEFLHDYFFSKFELFNALSIFRPYTLTQPSTSDTMGDILFTLIAGMIAGALVLGRRQKKKYS